MKRIVFLIAFTLISFLSFSQGGYGGIIYDNKASFTSVRPYFLGRLSEKVIADKWHYSPVVGGGWNSLGNITAAVGFDLSAEVSEESSTKILTGFSVEIFGLEEVYQNFMPTLRFGIETDKFILVATNNWRYETFMLNGIKGYKPTIKPTLGLFYKINW